MCLLDTVDGALMLTLYIQPAANFLPPERDSENITNEATSEPLQGSNEPIGPITNSNNRDPIAFLYYSIILTALTVVVAVVIGVIQLLTMILNVAKPTGSFWEGVETAGNYYDIIGGGICGCFIVFGLLSVALYNPWRRWVSKSHRSNFPDEERQGTGTVAEDREAVKSHCSGGQSSPFELVRI